jgi:hypothetical protein
MTAHILSGIQLAAALCEHVYRRSVKDQVTMIGRVACRVGAGHDLASSYLGNLP